MSTTSNTVWTPIDLNKPLLEQIDNRVDEVKEAVGDIWPAQDLWAYFGYIVYSLIDEFEEREVFFKPEDIKKMFRVVGKNLRNPVNG